LLDGKPDLQGIWQALNTAYVSIEDHQPEVNMPGGIGVVEGGELPYTPEARKKQQENYANRATRDLVETKGFMPGTPRLMYMPFPFQIFQNPGQITMLFEFAHTVRWIYTNGTPHPTQGEITFYMGDSRGRWEGNTLVIETANMNDKSWFDVVGDFHTEHMRVTERLTMVDADTILYEATMDDPNVFTRPWTMVFPVMRFEEGHEVMEEACHEGDHSVPNMLSTGYKIFIGLDSAK
jgi:hypothetical protein